VVDELTVSEFDIVENLDGVDASLVFGPTAQLFPSEREGSSSSSWSEFREGLLVLTADESSVIVRPNTLKNLRDGSAWDFRFLVGCSPSSSIALASCSGVCKVLSCRTRRSLESVKIDDQ
jgi:hypothetical protein